MLWENMGGHQQEQRQCVGARRTDQLEKSLKSLPSHHHHEITFSYRGYLTTISLLGWSHKGVVQGPSMENPITLPNFHDHRRRFRRRRQPLLIVQHNMSFPSSLSLTCRSCPICCLRNGSLSRRPSSRSRRRNMRPSKKEKKYTHTHKH